MGVSGNPAVGMLDQNQVAKPFQFVSGIGNRAGIGGFNRCSQRGFNINAVIGAPFADASELGNQSSPDRPVKFGFTGFGRRCIA